LYYPASISTNYYVYASYGDSQNLSTYVKFGSSPTVIFPAFPAIIANISSGFTTATSTNSNYADYELMEFSGYYGTSANIVTWDYFKQPQATNSITLPEILPEIKERTGDLPLSSFSYNGVSYFDFINSQITSYESYINKLVKPTALFYDLVKEYRIYSLYPDSKSVCYAPEFASPDKF
jgi:hypothetical protein